MANVYQSVLDAGGSTPTQITPSDSNPASMTAGTAYEPTVNGYAIESSPASKTPSDSNPALVTSGSIIRPSANGYLVENPYKSGIITTGLPTGSSQTYTLDTGLSTIKELWVWMNGNGTYEDRLQLFVRYNSDDGNNCYAIQGYLSGSNTSGQAGLFAFGANNTRVTVITAISGGSVTFRTGSQSNSFGNWSELRWIGR